MATLNRTPCSAEPVAAQQHVRRYNGVMISIALGMQFSKWFHRANREPGDRHPGLHAQLGAHDFRAQACRVEDTLDVARGDDC